jgi:hypothetical protein
MLTPPACPATCRAGQVRWGHAFVPVLHPPSSSSEGRAVVDWEAFHSTVPVHPLVSCPAAQLPLHRSSRWAPRRRQAGAWLPAALPALPACSRSATAWLHRPPVHLARCPAAAPQALRVAGSPDPGDRQGSSPSQQQQQQQQQQQPGAARVHPPPPPPPLRLQAGAPRTSTEATRSPVSGQPAFVHADAAAVAAAAAGALPGGRLPVRPAPAAGGGGRARDGSPGSPGELGGASERTVGAGGGVDAWRRPGLRNLFGDEQ